MIKKVFTLIIVSCLMVPLYAQNLSEVVKLVANDRAPNDFYGFAVAISGDYAIVGSYLEDEDQSGSNNISGAGSAYIYWRDPQGNWLQKQKLVASDRGLNDEFGYSVAISGDFAIVGARWEDQDASGGNTSFNAGSAYIFERNGGTWIEVSKIVASDRDNSDEFGTRVGISGDYAIVGAEQEDDDLGGFNQMMQAGSAYIFKRNGGAWTEVQKLVSSDRDPMDNFGHSVAISEPYAMVTAWEDDQDSLGANSLNNSGSAYVFELDQLGTWNQVQKLVAVDRSDNDKLGFSVSISGEYAVIGVAYEDDDALGNNPLGNAGAAYIFERNNSGVWLQDQKIVPADRGSSDNFGKAVSIDGNLIIIGAELEDEDVSGLNTLSAAGSAYIFRNNGSGNWTELNKLVTSDREADDYFGVAVGISGSNAILGAFIEDHNASGGSFMDKAGSAYIFGSCLSASSINVSACGSLVSPSGNYTWTSSGTYSDTLPNSSGCDSIITVTLSINNSSNATITAAACDSYTSPSGNSTWSTSGTYSDTVLNVAGCDSVITVNLTIAMSNSTNITATACNSYTSPSGNNTWVTSGIFEDTLVNAFGCDSIITVALTINNPSSSSTNVSACSSFNSPSGNNTWTASGSYMDTISNTAGCDSIISVNLTIGISSSTINPSTCDSYTSPSGNETWTVSGIYSDTLTASAGCDSVITINLTIANSSSAISATACISYTSPSGNYIWLNTGSYLDTLTGSSGCDSVITVNLVITGNGGSTINASTCYSYTSPSGNHIWTSSGTYTDTLLGASGCDSIITVVLTVVGNSSSSINAATCDSYTSPSGNYTWTTSGTYIDTIQSVAGCDSIITVTLTVTTVDVSLNTTGTVLTSNATGSSYQWLDCDDNNTPIVGATSQSFTSAISGSYAVQVTTNGCEATSACFDVMFTSIREHRSNIAMILYPNPNKGNFTIQIKVKPFLDYKVRVVDLLGREVMNSDFTSAHFTGIYLNLEMDLSNEPSGIYHVQIMSSKGLLTTKKVVIE